MPLGQAHGGDEFGRRRVEPARRAQPVDQFGGILDRQQAFDDLDLPRPRQRAPCLAESLPVAKLDGRQIGRETLASGQLVVEAAVLGQFRRLAQLFEIHGAAAAVHQLGADRPVFGEVQPALALAGAGHPQLADILQDAEALEQGMRLRRPLAPVDRKTQRLVDILFRAQRAPADRRRFERPLLDDDPLQARKQGLGQFGVVRGLRRPDGIQLRLDQFAMGIELVERLGPLHARAETDRLRPVGQAPPLAVALVAAGEEFAQGAGILAFERLVKGRDPRLHRTGLGLACIGDPVRLEAAALVEMEDGTADLVQRERMIERPGAQPVGIEPFQRLACLRVGRHQPGLDQGLHQPLLAFEKTVAAAAGRAGLAPVRRQRGLGLGIAPRLVIGCEDADARVEHSVRIAVSIQRDGAPADGIAAHVDAESIGHLNPHEKCGYQLTTKPACLTICAGV